MPNLEWLLLYYFHSHALASSNSINFHLGDIVAPPPFLEKILGLFAQVGWNKYELFARLKTCFLRTKFLT